MLSTFYKIWAVADALWKQNVELAREVQEKGELAALESERVKYFSEKLVSVKAKLAASRAKNENSRWSTQGVAENASKVEDDVRNTLMLVFREVADAIKQKVAIFGLKLKDALKRVSSHIKMELQAAISRIRTELERDDSEVLRILASCRAVLHNRVAEARRSLPGATVSVVGFDVDIAVAEP